MFSSKKTKATHENTNRFNKTHLYLHTREERMSHQQQTDEEYGMNPFANNDSPIVMTSNNDGNLLPSSEEYKVDRAHRYKPAFGDCFWKVGALLCVGVLVAIVVPTVLVIGGEKKEYAALYPTIFDVDCDAVACTSVSLDLSAATATEPQQVWNIYYVDRAPLQVNVALPNLPSVHVYTAHQYPKQGMSCQHGEWLTPVNVAPNSETVSIPVAKSGAVVLCDAQQQMVAIAYHLLAAIPDATDDTVVVPLDLTTTAHYTASPSLKTLDLATTTSAVVPIAALGMQGESLLYTHDNARQIGDTCYMDGEMVYTVPATFEFGLHLWSIDLETLEDVSQTTVVSCVDEIVRAVGVVSYTNSMTTATTSTTITATPDNNSTTVATTGASTSLIEATVATTNATIAGTVPATTTVDSTVKTTNATSAEGSNATTTAATTFQEDFYD